MLRKAHAEFVGTKQPGCAIHSQVGRVLRMARSIFESAVRRLIGEKAGGADEGAVCVFNSVPTYHKERLYEDMQFGWAGSTICEL